MRMSFAKLTTKSKWVNCVSRSITLSPATASKLIVGGGRGEGEREGEGEGGVEGGGEGGGKGGRGGEGEKVMKRRRRKMR